MSSFLKRLAVAVGLLTAAGMVYVAALSSVMRRNVRGTDLPVLSWENLQESWLPALLFTAIGLFAGWGAYQYEKASDD